MLTMYQKEIHHSFFFFTRYLLVMQAMCHREAHCSFSTHHLLVMQTRCHGEAPWLFLLPYPVCWSCESHARKRLTSLPVVTGQPHHRIHSVSRISSGRGGGTEKKTTAR